MLQRVATIQDFLHSASLCEQMVELTRIEPATNGWRCGRRSNILNRLTSMVRNGEVKHSVPFVPVGRGRWLQRIEGTSLILVLVVSIPTAPTNLYINTLTDCSCFHLFCLFRLVRAGN
jgi:hypothetical protein